MDLNRTILVGRVSQAPQLSMTGNGQSVCNMGVATNRTWTDKEGNKQEKVEFHAIVMFGRTAEIANEFLSKGSPVLIEGRIETRSWVDREKVTHYKTEIVCENLQLGPRPPKQSPEQEDSMFPGKKPLPVPDIKLMDEARPPHAKMPSSSVPDLKPIFGEPEKEINPSDIPF